MISLYVCFVRVSVRWGQSELKACLNQARVRRFADKHNSFYQNSFLNAR